jgi:hypothetical protein
VEAQKINYKDHNRRKDVRHGKGCEEGKTGKESENGNHDTKILEAYFPREDPDEHPNQMAYDQGLRKNRRPDKAIPMKERYENSIKGATVEVWGKY